MCWVSEDVLTLPVQQTMILERVLHRNTSDIFFYVPAEIAHDTWRNPLNVAVQHTI